jgi:hypothetical protein
MMLAEKAADIIAGRVPLPAAAAGAPPVVGTRPGTDQTH